MLKMGKTYDTLNIQDDHPTILFGPIEERSENEEVPPFYVILKIHDMILHNVMLDSRASHNLMPKVVMDQLGLDVTRPYKDLFSFDYRNVKCLGMIKDMVVSLAQIPTKNMVMEVVHADIPPKFSMFLSKSWASKLKGPSRWTCHMPLFLSLVNTKHCTGRFCLNIWLAINHSLTIILSIW
jgi:hypothetical protein